MKKTRKILVCKKCNIEFYPISGHLRQQYCGKVCAYSREQVSAKKGKKYPHLQRARVGNCKVCGKEYRAVNDHKKRQQVYCSRECFGIGWAKYSRPNIVVSNFLVGDKNKSWKGDLATYSAIHYWVSGNKGKPKKCEHCGTTKAKKFEWANIDHEYKRDLNDYIRLCTPCHRKYDNTYLKKV